MKKLRVLLLMLLPLAANASHLVGGCFELKWLGGANYRLIVKILRDCENGNKQSYFDNNISVGIYEKGTNAHKTTVNLSFDVNTDDTLKFTGPNCANIITGCTHIATYTKDIVLSESIYTSSNGYYMSWQKCCRNGIISNIIQPGEAGMALYGEFPNTKFIKSSSPYYTNSPNTLLCINNLFQYNMNFKDDDGDDLTYSFVQPLNGTASKGNTTPSPTPGPYTTVVWSNGYSNQLIIPGSLALTINPLTGELTCNPNAKGVFVASIRVEEFRFGAKIGEVRLDLQFTVTDCPNSPPLASVITLNNRVIPNDTLEVTIPDEVCVRIMGLDQTDSVYMRVVTPFSDSMYVNKPVFDSTANGTLVAETKLCLQSACEHEGMKPIPVHVYLYDNGCPFSKNSQATFWIKIKPMPLVNPTDLLCMTLVNNAETYFYYGDSTSPANQYFSKYYIYRGVNYQNPQLIDSISTKAARQYHDVNTPQYDKINYTYFMTGVNNCGREGPTSDTLGTFEQLTFIPERQYINAVTVADNSRIEIAWPPSKERDFAKYFLYKSIAGKGGFELIKTFENAEDTFYSDRKVAVMDTSYCYHLVMKDTCDNVGPAGKVACSILLKGKAAEYMNNIHWTAYEGWAAGVETYGVFRADPTTVFAKIAKTDSSVVFKDDQLNLNEGLFYYYIMAKQRLIAGNLFFDAVSRSNTIELYQPPIVYVPNAFTANGDGLNDHFSWVPVFVKDFQVKIYDRWGEEIYTTNNKNAPWDGTYKSLPCQPDVYFFRMSYTGWEGTEKNLSGNFTLLR